MKIDKVYEIKRPESKASRNTKTNSKHKSCGSMISVLNL